MILPWDPADLALWGNSDTAVPPVTTGGPNDKQWIGEIQQMSTTSMDTSTGMAF